MKKLFAAMIALCLLLCSAALAEEAVQVNWSDYFEGAIAAANVAGGFVTFDEIAVKFWIPEELKAVELTDEDRANGFIGYYADENNEAKLAVVYVNMDGMTVEQYAETLKETDGVTEIEMAVVNGLQAVNYQVPDSDTLNVAFATEKGYILEITMAPLSAEGADMVWGAVASSIQAAD